MPTPKKVEKQMIDPEHAVACVNKILTEFTNQEMGNKVTQFNMQGMANILVAMINNPNSLTPPPEQAAPAAEPKS